MCTHLHKIRDQALEQFPKENWEGLGWHLHRKAEELQGTATTLSEQVRFLSSVFLMELTPSDKRHPYTPMMEMQGKRTALPKDFTPEQLALLDDLLEDSAPPVWGTRMADVLWICRFHNDQGKPPVDYAQLAIAQYLDLAKLREASEEWMICGQCLERALGLAKEINQPDTLSPVIAHMEKFLECDWGETPPFLSCHLMKILLDCYRDLQDSGKYLQLSEKHARQEEEQGSFHKAEAYWTVHKQWATQLKNTDARDNATTHIAEGYVKRAKLQSSTDGGSAMVAVHWLEKAVEAYRGLPHPQYKERYVELYSLLRQYQHRALSELKKVEIPIELSEELGEAHNQFLTRMRDDIKNLPLQQCLYHLAFRWMNYPDYSQLQVQAQTLIEGSVWFMLQETRFDEHGRIVERRPARLGTNAKEQKEAEWWMVMELARIEHSLNVHWFIKPCRQYLVQQHQIEQLQILPYCQDNPFVAPGQEALYAQGLHEGLQGNFISATHLLVPLVENSLRYLLNQRGIETSQFKNGVQEEFPISKLLDLPVFTELWGDNQTRDLKAILSARSYANLRNRVAHGLMLERDYSQPVTEYLWWTVLRLVLFDSASRNFHPDNGDNGTDVNS